MITIPIIYEDDYILIVSKPAGVIVHEGAGNPNDILKSFSPESEALRDGNLIPESASVAAEPAEDDKRGRAGVLLTDWIKRERPEIIENFKKNPDPLYFRPGIVHRLDKDTSGLLVIAKTPEVKAKLQALFKGREVEKEYVTLVLGKPEPEEGSIETFIARNPHHRREMAVSFTGKGKEAKTEYRTEQTWYYRYKGQNLPVSFVSIKLHTGRMHQIRVHMKYKGWPVLGDQTYQTKPSRNISKELKLDRQFLHARRLALTHPETGERVEVESDLPEDLAAIIDKLEANP